uniref:ubiquitinyl hydrolase 1 n=1 Tax=Ciona savignyi TaxID=51511 RepID=H2ZJG5_CIOSA
SNPGVCGLYNLGNTCYMNSTLQCLLHNFELMKHMQHSCYIIDFNPQITLHSDENGISTGIAHYFSKLLKKYWSGEFSVVVPDEFKQQLAKIHSQFDGNGQHDGQELLALFLESLHQERKTMIKSNVSSTEETTNGHNTDTTADKLWDKYIDDNQSAIVDIFQGQLESTVICSKCEFKSVTYEPFMYLSLPLNSVDETSPGEQTLTLEMCLSAYTKSEILDDENPWYCPTCCCHQVAEKQLRICRWPDTLIVYIKRFLYHSKNAVKVDDEVLFPMESFNPGAISGTRPNRFKSYNLVACMSHFGGVYSGHYTAHCKHPVTGKWYLYNDENVSEQELSSKDNAGAYVLFYQHNAARNSSLYS